MKTIRRDPRASWIRGAAVLILGTASASEAAWEKVPLPFSRANVHQLALSPKQPARLYMTVDGLGVFRTDDRGATWTRASGGLPLSGSPNGLAVSESNADHAWAGYQSVWRTTDAGANWTPGGAIPGFYAVDKIIAHASNPSILNIVKEYSLYRSTDAGASWVQVGANIGSVWDLDSRSASPDVILAATNTGAARSTDAGATWTPGTGPVFRQIEMVESDPNRVYALRNLFPPHIPYASTNGGASFVSLGEVFDPDGTVVMLAAHPTNADIVVLGFTYDSTNSYGLYPKLRSSSDGGETWSGGGIYYFDYDYYSTVDAEGFPSALVIDPTNPNHVYLGMLGTFERGFFHSSNGGSEWTVRVDGIDNYSVGPVRGQASGENFAGVGDQLFRSENDLDDWKVVGAGHGYGYGNFLYGGTFELADSGTMWSAGHTNGGGDGDLWWAIASRSTDGGVSWWPEYELPPGLPTGYTLGPVIANHGDESSVYITARNGGFYRSTDRGGSYTLVNPAPFTDGVIDPSDANRLFVAGYDPPVSLSTDGGVSFVPRAAGLPVASWQEPIRGIFMRSSDPDYLEIVYDNGQVWETFDAGMSWSLRFSLAPGGNSIGDVTWDEATGHVFATAGLSVPVSSHPLFDPSGLPTGSGWSIHWDAAKSTLLLGTGSAGLWSQELQSVVDAPVVASALNLSLHVSPNPSDDASSVRFAVPLEGAEVRADVYDASGRRVRRLVDARLPGGDRQLVWDGRTDSGAGASAGIYFVNVRVAEREASARIVRVR